MVFNRTEAAKEMLLDLSTTLSAFLATCSSRLALYLSAGKGEVEI